MGVGVLRPAYKLSNRKPEFPWGENQSAVQVLFLLPCCSNCIETIPCAASLHFLNERVVNVVYRVVNGCVS